MAEGREREAIQEQAALYALGALTQHEARAFEQYLSGGETEYAAELQIFDEVAEALAYSATEAAPSAALRERLLAGLPPTQAAKRTLSEPFENQFAITRYSEIEWQLAAPGLWAKELFKDPIARTVTTLYKFEPGMTITKHSHQGSEQCFILEGDFIANGETFGPGDYHCAMPQSTHELITTTQGAVVLVIAPYAYEVKG